MLRSLVIALSLFVPPLWAQLQLGVIKGRVLGPDDNPIKGASIILSDRLGSAIVSTQSDETGQFDLSRVNPGSYFLKAGIGELHSLAHPVSVQSALPIEVELRLLTPLAHQLVVTSTGEASLASGRISLSGESARIAPERIRSRGVQAAVATTPGWATEDNGVLHVRGVDDGFLYVVDGVPVYDRLDNLFGFSADASAISSIHVLTGYIPPEFGLKSGGVIEVRSESARPQSWTGTVELGAGTERTNEISGLALGPITKRAALALSFSGQGSRRFLDPVHPANFHNDGDVHGAGANLSWSPSARDSLSLVAGYGGSSFQVPHDEIQERSGQDQRQRLRANFQSLSWQRLWSGTTVFQISGYSRATYSRLLGSPADTPLTVEADRSQRRTGFAAGVTHYLHGHTVKGGMEVSHVGLREFFSFAVTDENLARESGLSPKALQFTRESPFEFRDSTSRHLWSFYLQDSFPLKKNFAVDAGVRFDHSKLLLSESQWSPRIGISYRFPSSGTAIRASWCRFFQPPQIENLLLSSSREARALSPFAEEESGRELRAERQTALEVGVGQRLGSLIRLDIGYWRRRVQNYSDPNVFFGTTVIFPNSVARGRAAGIDLRLEVPKHKGWSGYLSISNSHVVQYGPINGGLFLEHDFIEIGPGTRFTPDHDQRNVAAAGISHEHQASGIWFSLSGRHESGTPLSLEGEELEELKERPGAQLVNFERGRVKPRTILNVMAGKTLFRSDRLDVAARLEALNLANQAYAFNFGNPFSGTHFGSPRTLAVKLRISMR